MNILGIVPARYDSTRFPGKPLVEIKGKSMINRVYEQSSKAFKTVYVATDDDRIYNHVKSFGGRVIMTSHDHKSGTDRCAEAALKISKELKINFDIVVNIQGDEPFIQPSQLELLVSCFENSKTDIATLVKPIEKEEDIWDPNKPKVILNNKEQAIYFSRSAIPYLKNVPKGDWLKSGKFYKHIGLYAYRYKILQEITKLPMSDLELSESLEQLRWIENDYRIGVKISNIDTISIDTPEDLKKTDYLPDSSREASL
jgi:3-deoxy-manno-octulosonate cytidylyltransferase (CMP-KDO synthetase)